MKDKQWQSPRHAGRHAADERGQAVLETALVTVVLLLLFAGAVDVGRMFYHYIAVTNASREGARTASRLACDSGSMLSRAAYRNLIIASAIDEAGATDTVVLPTNVLIIPNPVADGCPLAGRPIQVLVHYDHANIFTNFLDTSLRLSGSTIMVAFGQN